MKTTTDSSNSFISSDLSTTAAVVSLNEIDLSDLNNWLDLNKPHVESQRENVTIETNPVYYEQQQQPFLAPSTAPTTSGNSIIPKTKKPANSNNSSHNKLKKYKKQPAGENSDDDGDFVYFGHKKVRKNTPEYYQCREKSTKAVVEYRKRAKVKQVERELEIIQIVEENKRLKAQVDQLVAMLNKVLVQMNPVKSLPEEVENLLRSIKF
jgi:hypothetical protein